MSESTYEDPHNYDHTHSSSAGSGWLRASVFGVMDGLVSNIGLITGIAAAGASPHIIAITGVSGLIAGAVSMALGEYTSVRTQNDQLEVEVEIEREALERNPDGEEAELSVMFEHLGMTEATAKEAASQVHANTEQALRVHLAHELGLSVDQRQSPFIAAISSFIAFSIGALIPVLPFFFAFGTLWWGLAFGAIGLLGAGFLAARFTSRSPFTGALRLLIYGGIAVAATYLVGTLFDVGAVG